MIQQTAVAIRGGGKPIEETFQHGDVIGVDLREQILVLLFVGMMRRVVEAFADTTLWEAGVAAFACHHQRGDAGDFGFVGQHLQIEHQVDVVLETVGDAQWRIRYFELL